MDINFSEYEKQIITKLVNVTKIEDRALVKYIYDEDLYIAIEWDENFSKVKIYFRTKDAESLKIWDSLCETLFLLIKLESNGLIGVYNINIKHKNNGIFNRKKYSKNEQMDIYFQTTEDGGKGYNFGAISEYYSDMGIYLQKYSGAFVYVSQSLKELVKDKFQTKEEKRHKYVLAATWIAIVVAVLIGIFKTDPTLDSINNSNTKILERLDSINSKLFEINKRTQ